MHKGKIKLKGMSQGSITRMKQKRSGSSSGSKISEKRETLEINVELETISRVLSPSY